MHNHEFESEAKKYRSLQKGKYVFVNGLTQIQPEQLNVPFFIANAILIEEDSTGYIGDVALVNLSDLILRQSVYIDENGQSIEAHKLYVWPRNLGSTAQWTTAKEEFLNQYILNFPIEVLSIQESNGVTWRYISPENFKKVPLEIQASPDFQSFLENQHEYFFLRRPINKPL